MSRRHAASIVAAVVAAFWIVAFVTGLVSPARAWSRIEVATSRPAAASVAAGSILSAGVTARLRHRYGDYAHLVLVRLSSPTNTEATEQYLALLDRRYRRQGTRVVTVRPGERDSALVALLGEMGVLPYRHFTTVIDSTGRIRFLMRTVVGVDNLRQLVERTTKARASTEFSMPERTPAEWNARLAHAQLAARHRDGGSAEQVLRSSDYLLVFEAHCSTCRIRADIERIDSLRAVMPAQARLTVVFPAHYFQTAARTRLDSLDLPVLRAAEPVDEDLAYVSRDVAAARPRLLRLTNGRVSEQMSPAVWP